MIIIWLLLSIWLCCIKQIIIIEIKNKKKKIFEILLEKSFEFSFISDIKWQLIAALLQFERRETDFFKYIMENYFAWKSKSLKSEDFFYNFDT